MDTRQGTELHTGELLVQRQQMPWEGETGDHNFGQGTGLGQVCSANTLSLAQVYSNVLLTQAHIPIRCPYRL